jgi:hypothetical protein
MKSNRFLRAFSLIELAIVTLIIGILIAGVTEGARLLFIAKVGIARTITGNAPVNSIKNLLLWVDSTSETSFADAEIIDGSGISTWYDLNQQSTIKNDFIQTSKSRRPIYVKDGINTLPALRFNNEVMGIEDFMSSRNFPGVSSSATVFLVIKTPSSLTSTQTILSKANSNDSGTNLQVDVSDAAFLYCDGISTQNCYSGTTDISTTQSYIIAITYLANYDDGGIKFFKNGGAPIAIKSTFDSPNSLVAENLTLGKTNLAGNQYFNGFIGEIIIFDRALKDEERISIQNYLSKKWGIKIF